MSNKIINIDSLKYYNDKINQTKQDVLISGENIKTINGESILGEGDIITSMTSVTYAELKSLRDNSQLIQGQQYRITDYVTTTTQENTQSAGHSFDVIVTADDESTLNKKARAIQHEGDEYFANSDLDAWEIWYCLDNDTSRFAWAGDYFAKCGNSQNDWLPDSVTDKVISIRIFEDEFYIGGDKILYVADAENGEMYFAETNYIYDEDERQIGTYTLITGKGVIYRMIDEFNNDCPYDFKNIQFKRGIYAEGKGIAKDEGDEDFNVFCYTFSFEETQQQIIDASIYGNNGYLLNDVGQISGVYGNTIKPYISYDHYPENPTTPTQVLNNIVFFSSYGYEGLTYYGCYSNSFEDDCYSNSFGNNCFANTFGNYCFNNLFGTFCQYNSFGNGCYNNSFRDECYSNSFGNICHYNTFGNYCYSNSFGNDCYNNSFGNYCYNNSFGNSCNDNSFGNDCYSNSFGKQCYDNSFGNICYYNSFGYNCDNNSFGNEFYNNSFGDRFYHNSFGDYCYRNSFGNLCYHNTFGTNCHENTFGISCNDNTFGTNCHYNSFGNDCCYNSFKNYCHSISFGNECRNNSFGYSCDYNSLGDFCWYNSIGGYCRYNSFGNDCRYNSFRVSADRSSALKDYVYYNHFDDGCSYNVIWNADTTSSSVVLKNINVNRGVVGTSSSYNYINVDTINSEKEININNYNGHIYIDYDDIFKVTYSELVALRDNSQLIPGRQYRITDYVTSTSQENTQSANHQFDIIVTAIDESTLSEEAQAIQNIDNGYFDDSDLSAWKIWYCLDNDTNRFAWAGDEITTTEEVEVTTGDSSECTIKSELIDGNSFITPFNFESCVWVDGNGDGEGYAEESNHDAVELIYEWGYFDNPKTGNTELCIYKSDADLYEEEGQPDYADKYLYRGIVNVDGTDYDYWQKWDAENESLNVGNHGGGDYVYATTPRIVSNPEAYSFETTTETIETIIQINPKGVIYRMIDEFNNDCPYDFKNIQFKHPKDTTTYPDYYYTFSTVINNSVTDHSILQGCCYDNTMKKRISSITHKLNNNVFLNTSKTSNCSSNSFGNDCHGNSFGDDCHRNSFGNNCFYNTFGNRCFHNTFGNECRNNSFGNSCYENSFGNSCYSNFFGNDYYNNSFGNFCRSNSFGNICSANFFGDSCYNNSFGNNCKYNSFGDICYRNSFGNDCSYNSFGNDCYENSFVNECYMNSFGNYCHNNSFGNGCNYNSFGNRCERNSFGNYCGSNSFGNDCNYNSFGYYCGSNSFGNDCGSNSFGNDCRYNSFGNDCRYNSFRTIPSTSVNSNLKSYCYYNHFDDGCSYNVIWSSDTTGSGVYLQNININRGVSGTSSSYNYINISTLNSEQEINVNQVDGIVSIGEVLHIKYESLKSLRDNSQLIPGRQYRIIDYVTKTSQENTQSAGHPFDIIVTALDEYTLSEEAQAIQNIDDGYFDDSNLSAWKLWYCLDNDTDKFAWAGDEITTTEEVEGVDSSNCTISVGYSFDEEEGLNKFDNRVSFVSQVWNDPGDEAYLEGSAIDELITHWGYETEPNGIENCLTLYGLNLEIDEETGEITSEDGISEDRWYYRGIVTVDDTDYDYWEKAEWGGNTGEFGYMDNDQFSEKLFFLTDRIVSGEPTITTVTVETVIPLEPKGVIYRMIDEFNNDCPYDFKNIMFKCPIDEYKDEYPDYYYTFSTVIDGVVTDHSMLQGYCYGNTMKEYISSKKQKLNNNVFLNTSKTSICYSNSFGYSCYYNTFGNGCYNNSFGNYCQYNSFGNDSFGDSCSWNSFGNNCSSNSFGDSCIRNSFGNWCNNNSFGNNCSANSFGDGCSSNSFGKQCSSNSFGKQCSSNSFGNGCNDNSFGNDCYSNSFGKQCYDNSFGNNCRSNSFGDYGVFNSFGNNCSSNSFGNNCRSNSFGNECYMNSFGNECYMNSFGNYCKYNSFRVSADGSSTLKDYVRYNHFDDGCSYNVIWNADTTSSSVLLKNINVNRGVSGTSSTIYNYINVDTINSEKEININNYNGHIYIDYGDIFKVTYSELVALRNYGQLITGRQYRIIDYVTTTSQENTQAAGHQFDIIVTADDVNILNEKARAIQHNGDEYFANSDLNTWEIWYSLDNDTERFAWADAENGKGVIYRMIDEFNNDIPYDFKNIQFKRKLTDGKLDTENGVDTWCYTFNAYRTDNTTIYDASVIAQKDMLDDNTNRCYGNIIKEYYRDILNEGSQLNDIVFLNTYTNEVYFHCRNNSFGYHCRNNSFGNNCYNNSFGNNCYNNTFGNGCYNNSFGNGCHHNSFGNDSFGDSCSWNSFGNYCQYNTFGNYCRNNSFGNGCHHNSFGNDCNYNSFGDDCGYNSFGNACGYNSFGNDCGYNSFGNDCDYNTFGNRCYHNSFRVSADGSSALKDYVYYNHFDDGCSYNVIWNVDTTSSSVLLKNINVNRGIAGTSSSYNYINIDTLNQDYEIQVAKNSKGEIKIYCEADLIA